MTTHDNIFELIDTILDCSIIAITIGYFYHAKLCGFDWAQSFNYFRYPLRCFGIYWATGGAAVGCIKHSLKNADHKD